MKKYYINLTEQERSQIIHSLIDKKNALMDQGRYLIMWMAFIGWAGKCGSARDLPKENKNPYSVGNAEKNQ